GGRLKQRMMEAVDGDYQLYKSKNGAYVREHFFGRYPETQSLVEKLSDDDIWHLNRGGHDAEKVHAAYHAATEHHGQPTVILAKTIKGYGLGTAGESQNIAHQKKKIDVEALRKFRDRFDIPVTDKQLEELPFVKPEKGSKASEYLLQRREQLGGYLPARHTSKQALEAPKLKSFKDFLDGTGEREASTTMIWVRILSALVKDKAIGDRIVPIVPDEARTFGMEGLFRQIGIYSSVGQLYTPQDAEQLMYYREDQSGQILQEGINEAGSFCSWLAAATSYANHDLPLIPFYIYYSMFGFQRIGDFAWAAGDMRSRGFLIGGTAGRTTLAGEGLQHQDGHSLLLSSTIPNCVSYDPCYAYEMAVIIQHGLQRMMVDQDDVYFYVTAMNENYIHPKMPKGAEQGIKQGMYQLSKGGRGKVRLQLFGSGTILREVEEAAKLLEHHHDVPADIWSVTSYSELRRDALATTRWNRLHPEDKPKQSFIEQQLNDVQGPVIAASDYMQSVADQVREWVPGRYVTLGTDGFGRSDGRKALREHFEVDRHHIVIAALKALVDDGQLEPETVRDAMREYGLKADKPNPVDV
ncbi:MAG: pyruvate dehydrogenase (acetyl-transferring), homodimeric type, partial [Gammaproteobacteria bacterium]|nr:pyruvate dehydrogenase (acetyl-transferring), homodimeric type [Gammaproteobacteria bacterium]